MNNDTEILLTSQAEAKRVLDAFAGRAAAVLAKADKTAGEQLIMHRERAARLLFEKHELALGARKKTRGETVTMSDAATENRLARHDAAAKDLANDEERVAAELVEAEEALAQSAMDKATGQARAILMAGHREAAAILLEARMRVELRGRR